MYTPEYVIALDSGSQSSRAIIFSTTGELVAKGQRQHSQMRYPEPGAVEQDPMDIRQCLFGAITDCLKSWGKDPSLIRAGALTTQRNTIMPTDENGVPLQDAISWLDRRTANLESEPSKKIRLLLKVMGKNGLVPRLLAKSIARQLQERRPDIVEKMKWISPVESWLHYQLTGNMALAPGGIAGPWPFDCAKRQWNKPGFLYSLLGFEEKWLPKIVEAGEVIGHLTAKAALETGLREGLPFYSCGGDKQAEILGAGVRVGQKDIAAVSLGTGSSISLISNKPLQHRKYLWLTTASVEKDSWSLEYLLFRGMWTAKWFVNELARDLIETSEKSGIPPEALLCDEAAKTPAGSDGVVTWPRWSPTLQFPTETGTTIGLRETHCRGHLFRSLLEGIAMDLKRGLTILEKATGVKVKKIAIGGGGAKSDLVVQILADVLGLPVLRPHSEELAARGAAMVAAKGVGLFHSMDDAILAMTSSAPVIEPNPDNVAVYKALYQRVFLPGLKILRKSSKEALDIIGAG